MIGRYIKRLAIWLVPSLIIGIAFGSVFSLYFGDGADLDRFTAAGNGAIAGAWLGLFGAFGAAGTTGYARDRLRQARGSEFLTGSFVSFGLIVIGTLMLWVAG